MESARYQDTQLGELPDRAAFSSFSASDIHIDYIFFIKLDIPVRSNAAKFIKILKENLDIFKVWIYIIEVEG
jgi:hypothetical protein